MCINQVWLNADAITWLEDADDGGCHVNFAGGDPDFVHLDLTCEQVAEIIRGLMRGPTKRQRANK